MIGKINESTVSEKDLLEQGYKKYRGKDMDIFFNRSICQYAAECVRGNPEVFDTSRRPWILPDNGSVAYNEEILNRCPTGALKYIIKDKSKNNSA